MAIFNIRVTSDPVCPFVRLPHDVSLHPDLTVSSVLHRQETPRPRHRALSTSHPQWVPRHLRRNLAPVLPQSFTLDCLFARYFEQGGDITSLELLVEVAQKAGLDGGEVRGGLEQGAGGEEGDTAVAMAVEAGVKGVPMFEINGRFVGDGAQDVDVFFEEFLRAKES